MTERNDGGYAFPQYARIGEIEQAEGGLSIRDWFAGQAMQRVINVTTIEDRDASASAIAKLSYFIADAMLAERDRK